MAFKFTNTDEVSKELMTKFTEKQVYDADVVVSKANSILETLPEFKKETLTDAASACTAVLEMFDSYFATNSGSAPVTDPTKTVPTATAVTSDAPTAAETKAAAKVAKEKFQAGVTRSKSAAITGVMTSKPSPASRFKAGTKITVKVSADFKTKFNNEYGQNLVPDSEVAGNAANYEAMKKLVNEGGETAMYINEKARPTIAGYKITDPAADKGEVYVKKDKFALAGLLTRDYATKIQEHAGVSVVGAYISRRTKNNKGVALVGKDAISVKMTGLGKYFQDAPDGEPIYIENKEATEEVSAKSELCIVVYAVENGVVNKKKKKTIRLSGRTTATKIEQNPSMPESAKMAGLRVKASRGDATTPDFSNDDKATMAAALAILGHGQEASVGIGSELHDMLTGGAGTSANEGGID